MVDGVFALEDVSVALNQTPILHGVNLQIPKAKWTCCVGPNGSGKSTLLKAMAGLLPLTQGEVRLLGRALSQWTSQERAQALSWLGQGETVVDDLRVWDVVMLGRLPHQSWWSVPNEADHAAVMEALQQTECEALRHRTMGQLSGGERQRVLMARALAVDASILLMDEPLAHLDPPHQVQWMQLVQALVAQGKTVVSVLHELPVALHADELVIVQAGRILHQGASHDRATHRHLEAVFDQRIRIDQLHEQWVVLPCLG